MNSINALKQRIDGLNSRELSQLEKWLTQQENSRNGELRDCFVIMPFSMTRDGRSKDYWNDFFTDFLTKSLTGLGLRVRRSQGSPENIVTGIMEDLAWTSVVLAVLTDSNVNVWYELGVRHSLRRGSTVMICQDDQIGALPFDLKHHGVVAYTPTLDRDKFVEKLAPHLAKLDGKSNDSPVCGFTNSGTTYCVQRALAQRREVLRRIRDRNEQDALVVVDSLNEEWKNQDLQITILKDGFLFRHQGGCQIGMPADECFVDAVSGNASQYQTMKTYGEGLWFGSIKGHLGRLTAIAYTTLDQRGWLLAIESHIRQSDL